MAERYELTQLQAAALRALNEGVVELSPLEVAVQALLRPDETRHALSALQDLNLVHSWPIQAEESVFEVTGEGQTVARALAQFDGTPPIGTVIRLPNTLRRFSDWLTRRERSSVEIVPDAVPH